jgi:hypothetical protein
MSDIHVLDVSGGSIRIACHIPVPSGNNSVAVPWSTALVNSGRAAASVMPTGTGAGQIVAAEAAQLAAGTLVEIVLGAPFEPGATAARQQAEVRETWAQAQRQALLLQQSLAFFGATFARS